jgi:excisionase family DNA binding protein
MKHPAPKPILTLQETCIKLRLCKTTLVNLLNDGTIPGMKVGRQWRILDESIDAFLRGGHDQRGTTETRPTS